MKKTTKLRAILKEGKSVFVPGCYNALSAKILDQVGFPAIYMTGYGTSLSLLGMPDCGLATMTEMHLNARNIANVTSAPVIADSDNGYGNAINVIRTVREYIQTGVAAIHIEDQIIPKRCGHVAGRMVISMEEACGKYRAADYARKEIDPDFVLIARTDARGAHGGAACPDEICGAQQLPYLMCSNVRPGSQGDLHPIALLTPRSTARTGAPSCRRKR